VGRTIGCQLNIRVLHVQAGKNRGMMPITGLRPSSMTDMIYLSPYIRHRDYHYFRTVVYHRTVVSEPICMYKKILVAEKP
jgi:hypothetical protein